MIMKTNILITATLATLLLAGCVGGLQKSDATQGTSENTEPKECSMTLTTVMDDGGIIKLAIETADEHRADVWVDLNNNGVKDEGEAVTNFGKNAETEYVLGAQTVTIHGKVSALWCRENQLTTLDISNNPQLTELECSYNLLTTLDASKSEKLAWLHCYNNQLTSLNIANCLQLNDLECSHNQLAKLDLSSNLELANIDCFGNQLTTLDLSNNSNLKWLNCGNNKLGMLDVSKNVQLNELYCGGNQLTILDLSSNTELERLSCPQNQLTALDLSKNLTLREIHCETNKISDEQMTALVNSLPNRSNAESPGVYKLRYWLEDENVFKKAHEVILLKKCWHEYEECGL